MIVKYLNFNFTVRLRFNIAGGVIVYVFVEKLVFTDI